MAIKKIFCSVTNDLNQDQRMYRICNSLSEAGYEVWLTGRIKANSPPLLERCYKQKRLYCFFDRGFLFYAEFNIRLLFWFMTKKIDLVYAVDLDTLLPAYLYSKLFRKKFVFDCHEYFTETPELKNSPFKIRIWNTIAKVCIPASSFCFTVNDSLASLFSTLYKVPFISLYNVPDNSRPIIRNESPMKNKTILYQGVLNQGRGLETLIEAMKFLPGMKLHLVGEGDISTALRRQALDSPVSHNIIFKGMLFGKDLEKETISSWIGINVLDINSKSYYYSLANKFFDYMYAGLPSIHMDFPEYRRIIDQYPLGLLLQNLKVETLVSAIKYLDHNPEVHAKMVQHCNQAIQHFTWKKEEIKLLEKIHCLINNR
ncbi:MAG: glycosyltransferase [Saprospiraceae bacterium]|nr:glycosyltransferase [Saprospiraceae bacterium]